MKPKYIFAAVFAVCLIMVAVLPRLAMAAPPTAAAIAQPAAELVLEQPAVEQQEVANQPPAEEAPLADAPPADPALAAAPPPAEQTAQDQPNTEAGGGIAVPSTVDGAAIDNIPLTADTSSLDNFAASITNGQTGQLTGVYVEGVLALPVLKQPVGDENFVANVDNSITEYARSLRYGTVGLLAHNTLSGIYFFNLKPNMEVVLVYGDGQKERYRINKIDAFQALSPNDTHSTFIDLADPTQTIITHEDVFNRIYTHGNQLVFQTCIEANGVPTWGRLFVTAVKI